MSFHFVAHPWQVREVDDGTEVRVTSLELAGLADERLVDELLDLCLESGQPNLYLDFADVRLVTSGALDSLLGLHARLRQAGGKLFFRNLDQNLHRSMQVAGVTQ